MHRASNIARNGTIRSHVVHELN